MSFPSWAEEAYELHFISHHWQIFLPFTQDFDTAKANAENSDIPTKTRGLFIAALDVESQLSQRFWQTSETVLGECENQGEKSPTRRDQKPPK